MGIAHVTHIRTWPGLRTQPGGLIAWPGWRIALGAGAAATVVWELVLVGPAELLADLRVGLAYAGQSALFVFLLTATFAPALLRAWQLVRAWQLLRAAHVGRIACGWPLRAGARRRQPRAGRVAGCGCAVGPA